MYHVPLVVVIPNISDMVVVALWINDSDYVKVSLDFDFN